MPILECFGHGQGNAGQCCATLKACIAEHIRRGRPLNKIWDKDTAMQEPSLDGRCASVGIGIVTTGSIGVMRHKRFHQEG